MKISLSTTALVLVLAAAVASAVELPVFETTPAAIARATDGVIAAADARLSVVATLKPEGLSFRSVVVALDEVQDIYELALLRMEVIRMTHTDQKTRAAADEAVKKLENWGIEARARDDVYASFRSYVESTRPEVIEEREALAGPDRMLLDRKALGFQLVGFGLSAEARAEIMVIRKSLSDLSNQYRSKMEATETVEFTREELEGLPDDITEKFELRDGVYHVNTVFGETSRIYKNSPKDAVRHKALMARYSRANQAVRPITRDIVEKRAILAERLGFESWADYRTRPAVMGNGRAARDFLERVDKGLERQFRQDLENLAELKKQDLSDPNAKIEAWDIDYYKRLYIKAKYDVDVSQLREFLEYSHVFQAMLDVMGNTLGVEFKVVTPPYKWALEVSALIVSDRATGEALGYLYLDMFQRKGKADRFSHWTLIRGKANSDGSYRRPVSVLICAFPQPTEDSPTLLDYQETRTLFHEFGHAMHSLLTKAPYVTLSGTAVPRDFIEAPAAALEQFLTDEKVLVKVSKHYDDPTKIFPMEAVRKLLATRALESRLYDKRQIALALMDVSIHGGAPKMPGFELTAYTDALMNRVFLPSPKGTSFIDTFAHLFQYDYDAVYYTYVFAEVLAADLASRFQADPEGVQSDEIGQDYREEILAWGKARPIEESLRAFLGRDYGEDAYLKQVGVK